jgi:ketosteroid isomerase-like protein
MPCQGGWRSEGLGESAERRAARGAPPAFALPRDTGRAMSQENVELVREGCEAVNRGDLDSIVRGADSEIEIVEASGVPEAATYSGHDGLRQAFAHWMDQFADFRVEVERAIDDGDRVIWIGRQRARGKISGVPVEVRVGNISTFRGGKLVRWEMLTPAAALRAASDQRE